MPNAIEKWDHVICTLQNIRIELKLLTTASQKNSRDVKLPEFVHVPFKGSEIYLLHKAFVGAGGAFNENYKALSKRLYPNF